MVSRTWDARSVPTFHAAIPVRLAQLLEEEVAFTPTDVTPQLLEWRPGPKSEADSLVGELRPLLEQGAGFLVLDRLPIELGEDRSIRYYWLLANLFGRPMAQNVAGTVLYDVQDTGSAVEYGARFSVTNADSSFHTDNSFGNQVLDYVGLYCLRPARSGGISQISSAYSVYRRLAADFPSQLRTLEQPFHVDRRGGVKADESATAWVPIFSWQKDELLVRYLRYWIQVGHQKAGQPLTPSQVEALDTLDRVARDPGLVVEFSLEPGQVLLANNRWLFHNRTAFEDYPEPERRRRLSRLWLARAA